MNYLSRLKKIAVGIGLLFPLLQSSSIEGNVSISHDGKSEASINFDSTLSQEDFETKAKAKIQGYNTVSGLSDAVALKGISVIEGGYRVDVALRRADKVKVQGSFDYEEWSNFAAEGSEARKSVENAAKGNISTTIENYYDGSRGNIVVSRNNVVVVSPKKLNGETAELTSFLSDAASSNDRSMMLFFKVFDLKGVKSVKVTVPGTLKYIGGDGVKVSSSSEVEITPVAVPVTITKTVCTVDESGNEKYTTVVEKKNDAQALVGYFVYEKSLSPFEITLISIGCVLGVGLLSAFPVYWIILGKKEIAKKEKEEEYAQK